MKVLWTIRKSSILSSILSPSPSLSPSLSPSPTPGPTPSLILSPDLYVTEVMNGNLNLFTMTNFNVHKCAIYKDNIIIIIMEEKF